MAEEDEILQDRINRGKMAEDLLKHPLHQQARVMIEAELVKMNRDTKYDQHEERAEIWRKQQIVDWYEQIYARAVREGKLAEKSIKQKVAGAMRRVI